MKTQNKTFMLRKEDVERKWHLVDLDGQVLGRAATKIAKLLMGKDKPAYTPHVDAGDYVIAINAAKIEVTRNKAERKFYRWHTGFPGGLREIVFKDLINKHPERAIEKAVFNMLPKNKHRKKRMIRLKVYPLNEHPYQDQLTTTKR